MLTRIQIRSQRAFTLIEVLVSMVLILVGLLGVVGMQTKAANVELESYQRGQALSLARDLESRILASRAQVASYADATLSSTDGSVYLGEGSVLDCTVLTPEAKAEMCAWDQALKGASSKIASTNVGAMVGARGCLIRVAPPTDFAIADYFVVVVWQGVVASVDPVAGAITETCASAVDFGAGLRRGVAVRVLVPDLTKTT